MTAPIPSEKNATNGVRRESRSMGRSLIHMRKDFRPLPIKDGLNPTRVRTPVAGLNAWDFLDGVISTQRHRHPSDDAAALHARFAAGEVVLRDTTVLRPNSILPQGADVYFYRMPAPETPVPYDIPVVFEDEDILVVDKPPFMATMPRARHIVQTATVQLRRSTGNNELSPAHRLDRLTSGILLFTKRREVRGAYQTLFAAREVQKTYEAIAALSPFSTPVQWHSHMTKTPGEIQGRLGEGPPNAHTTLLDVAPLGSEETAAYESVHGPQPPLGRYRLQPHTGKTHQLRLHMWESGAPILGDPVYPVIFPAEAEDMNVPMHLSSVRLEFIDPLSGKARDFHSRRKLMA
ncbi:pseudouridine synthase [Corynebacterium flavescens]|uniref:pseudouridine synthase n=1 Tax=Corynebacterium flavescens TaxID=28028 RepID=UPI003FD2CC07